MEIGQIVIIGLISVALALMLEKPIRSGVCI